jgi:ribonucleoside-diphosphate reductase alpha chain
LTITVTKRSGNEEPLNIDKMHAVLSFACEDLAGVSVSEVAIKSQIQFYPKIKTKDIQETIIKAAADLISEDNPNYQYVAGRLISYTLRKEVYGRYEPPSLYTHVTNVVAAGYYDPELLNWYSYEEFTELNRYIRHDRDLDFTFAGMEQFRGKYLVKNRVTGEFFETPQMAFMLIAMTLFHRYGKDRLKWVKDYYDALSEFDISLPTPIMAGVRTPQRQFASCVVIETDDSLDSINATASSIVKYVSQKAGIGIGAGKIRALGEPIRNGDAVHTGNIPYYKYFQSAVKSCSQGGVRGGSATLHYPIWHRDVEDLLVLKNNKGTEDTRVRHLDYSVQFNRLFYERLIEGGDITLMSPNAVAGLYEAFFTSYEKFKELYEYAERLTGIKKKVIKAHDLFSAFMQERKDTGRVYLMNVDHCNTHSSFKLPIRMSNLCQEITLPTEPLNQVDDEEGMISTCILSAINWGKIKKPEDFRRPAMLAVRGLEELIDFQHYPVKAAEKATKGFRSLGVGIVNFAYWMAQNDLTYSNPDLSKIDEYAEAWSYYLIDASADLAIEKGKNPYSDKIKYADGILPIDTYKWEVNELVPHNPKMDWACLREKILDTGIRNATLMALMPAETSALISNSTNGIEPVRALVSVKQSKDGVLKQVVPQIRKYKNKFELLWDIKSPLGYLQICAILQKWMDQAISANTSYNPAFYENEELLMDELLEHILLYYRWGGKTLYYFNTNDGAGEIDVHKDKPELEQVESVVDDADCDSCKI